MNTLDSNIWSGEYNLSLPLRIPIKNGQSLVCNEVVRAIPGRRYVCQGVYGDKPVFIKLFSMTAQSNREYQREQQGIDALTSAGIPAPTIIYFESSPKISMRIVVFNELLGAESARQRWEQGNQAVRQMLMMQLVELMARHHAVGIRQMDCHLLNFIFSQGVLYTLDAADIIASNQPLSRRASMQGLADLFGLFTKKYDDLLPNLYSYYCECRQTIVDDKELKWLLNQVDRRRQYKLRKYLTKIYRNCSEFIASKSWNQFFVYRRDKQNINFQKLINIQALATSDDTKQILIKDGNTCTVSLVEVPQNKLVCKRYNIKNLWHAVLRGLRASRASRSWRNAHCLRRLNIATPQPLALIEQRFGPLRGKAWFFMAYIEGVSARNIFSDTQYLGQRATVVKQFTLLFTRMAQERLSHGDMKATNFIFSDDQLFIIDLDSMRQHKTPSQFKIAFRKDLHRFMQNWSELPDTMALFNESLSYSSVAEFLPDDIKS